MSAPVIEPVRSALARGRQAVEALDVRVGDFTASSGFYRIASVEHVLGGRGKSRRIVQVRATLTDGRAVEYAPDALVKVYRAD